MTNECMALSDLAKFWAQTNMSVSVYAGGDLLVAIAETGTKFIWWIDEASGLYCIVAGVAA